MAAFVVPQKFIESRYQPTELVTASPGRRLGGSLLEIFLMVVTLFVGWFIWECFAAANGQSPAKQLLRMYVMKSDGTRAGGAYTYWLRGVVIGFVTNLLTQLSLGIYFLVAAMWCLWDKDRQCLWDKMAGTYIAYSPSSYKPLTANEYRNLGQPLPIGRPTAQPMLTPATPAPDVATQLRSLSSLRDEKIISDEEYESRRQKLVERL